MVLRKISVFFVALSLTVSSLALAFDENSDDGFVIPEHVYDELEKEVTRVEDLDKKTDPELQTYIIERAALISKLKSEIKEGTVDILVSEGSTGMKALSALTMASSLGTGGYIVHRRFEKGLTLRKLRPRHIGAVSPALAALAVVMYYFSGPSYRQEEITDIEKYRIYRFIDRLTQDLEVAKVKYERRMSTKGDPKEVKTSPAPVDSNQQPSSPLAPNEAPRQ